MKFRIIEIIIILLILLSYILSIYFYPKLPEKIATHWNEKGEVDGYLPKGEGLFILPIILTGITLLLLIIPKIDPLKKNIEKFRKYYEYFIILFVILLLLGHIHTILWNIGIQINPNMYVSFSLGGLFYYIGFLCEKVKQNWFIGVRTPWTLSSERVWDKTNKISGKLLKILGIVTIFSIFFQNYLIYIILISVISLTIFVFIYSYIEYQKESK